MTITDAMVERALEAYQEARDNGGSAYAQQWMRAALEAACGEIVRENEHLRRIDNYWEDERVRLRRENEALRIRVRALEDAARESVPAWDKGNG